MDASFADEQRFVVRSGAWLLVLSLLSGGLVAAGMSGQLPIDGRIALGGHVTGLLGSLFLFAFAWSLPLLRYGPQGRRRLALALIVANYAGLILTEAKAFPAVHGVAITDSVANNVVFGLLNVFVVLPVLAGAIAWALGLRAATTK